MCSYPLKPTVRIILLVKQIMKLGRNLKVPIPSNKLSCSDFGSKIKFDWRSLICNPSLAKTLKKPIRPIFCSPALSWNNHKGAWLHRHNLEQEIITLSGSKDLNLSLHSTAYEWIISETQFSHLQVVDGMHQTQWRNASQMLVPKPVFVKKLLQFIKK